MRLLLTTALVATAAVLSACGSQAASSDVPNLPAASSHAPATKAAAVGHIVCTRDGATEMRTPRVRARRDGVHIAFHVRGDAFEFFMRGAEDPDNNHGGRLRGKLVRDVSSHGPGAMWVACVDRGEEPLPFYEDDPRYARFEIVDPNDLWVSPKPECDETQEVRDEKLRDAESIDEVEAWIRDRFGIDGGHRTRPGYPQTGWKLPTWVIVEDGTTLSYFVAAKDDGFWTVLIAEGCA